MPQTIRTDRLILRRFERSDAAAVAGCVGDIDVARWLTHVPHPYSEADGESFISRHQDKPLVFAVIRESTLVGCLSIVEELGYWFGKPWWGQGYATEAARAVVDRYFNNGGKEVRSGYVLGNDASRNVLTKLGFQDSKIDTATLRSSGETVSLQKMVLTAPAWQAHR